MANMATITTTVDANTTTVDDSSNNSSDSTPQRQPRRSSLKKTGGGRDSLPVEAWRVGDALPVEARRVAFCRSRSLSERSFNFNREGSMDRREGQSHLCRVRSFKSTRKGLVRDGETFKSTDTTTFMSTGSVRVYRKGSLIGRSESVDSTDSSVGGSSVAESYYRVALLGAPGVGKTTLVEQFIVSEDNGERTSPKDNKVTPVTVSVLLDGEESLLEFLDHSQQNDNNPIRSGADSRITPQSPDNGRTLLSQDQYDLTHCDAYAVVFALNDLQSFQHSGLSLRHLREELGTDRAIILVGNKSDLVRQRRVHHKDACALAHKYDSKYIETSAELGHQTDELLVGTLRQIRLKLSTSRRESLSEVDMTSKKPNHKWHKLAHLYHFLHGTSKSVDSCQNFFVS